MAYRRGGHLVVLNLGDTPAALPQGEVVVSTNPVQPAKPTNLPPLTGMDIWTG